MSVSEGHQLMAQYVIVCFSHFVNIWQPSVYQMLLCWNVIYLKISYFDYVAVFQKAA